MTRPKICILSLAPLQGDGRVLRQIEYASREYDVTVIAWGDLDKPRPHVQMKPVERHVFPPAQRLLQAVLMFGGRLNPALWDRWYWRKPDHRHALTLVMERRFDLIHVNESIALPIGLRAARQTEAKVVFDAHEYSPLLEADKLWGRVLAVPLHQYLIRAYAPRADAMITVGRGIAERYRQEFGLDPSVIMNTPLYTELPFHPVEPNQVRMIHHGMAIRDRHLEQTIELLADLDARFMLDLMLVDKDPGYKKDLKELADRLAPGRVAFPPAVAPSAIPSTLNRYDLGLAMIPPVNFSYANALPNKFFEFIMAGLAIAVGPSPEMARIVRDRGLGVVADSFDRAEMAARLTLCRRRRSTR